MQAEKTVGDILLKRGVKLGVTAPLFLRFFGKKKVEFTVQSPTMRTLLQIAMISLDIQIDFEKEITLPKAQQLMAVYGKSVCKVIAIAIRNGNPKWMYPFLTSRVKNSVSAIKILWLYKLIMVNGGYEDFITTIRFIEETRITKPMNLSQEKKRS